jgi:hypothetical protein
MPGFNGTGPNGMGAMTGGGRGFCNPGRIGSRSFTAPRRTPYPRYGYSPYTPQVSREQELDFLKAQADSLKNELNRLEAEISRLSSSKE